MLEVKGLAAGYGESIVLRGVDLCVGGGKLACVLGSNGVGKSTLLKAIMGILPARSGSVSWEGQDFKGKQGWDRARAGLGYVPQGREIFPFLTVQQNLALGLEASGAKSAAIHRETDAMYQTFPILKPLRRRRGGDLSGGQQQILAMARVLAIKPRLLILDEPSEGIQPSIVWQISDALGEIKKRGVSVLLVEQYPDFALTHADSYCLMGHGEIVESGQVSDSNRAEIKARIHI
jgi:urea transport system ATP-binding protein